MLIYLKRFLSGSHSRLGLTYRRVSNGCVGQSANPPSQTQLFPRNSHSQRKQANQPKPQKVARVYIVARFRENSTAPKFVPSACRAIPHITEHSVAMKELIVGQRDTLAQLWFQVPRQDSGDADPLFVLTHQPRDKPVAHILYSLRAAFSDLARPEGKSRETWAPAERREIRASAAAPDFSAEVSDRVSGFACRVAARAAGAALRPWDGAARRDRACARPGPAPVARLPFAGSRVSRSHPCPASGRGEACPDRGWGRRGLWTEGLRGRRLTALHPVGLGDRTQLDSLGGKPL